MKSKQYQSTFDLATQTSGDVKSVLDFCLKNDLPLGSTLSAGSEVNIPATQYINEDILSVYRAREVELATGLNPIAPDGFGIGWMIVNTNFDVT